MNHRTVQLEEARQRREMAFLVLLAGLLSWCLLYLIPIYELMLILLVLGFLGTVYGGIAFVINAREYARLKSDLE